jgi:nucleoid DNA-binding protein
MNHRQTVAEISKRLQRLKRRDVAEVLEVMTELWLEELAQPGQTVTVTNLDRRLARRKPRCAERTWIFLRALA